MQLVGIYTGKSKNKNQGFYYLYLEAVSIMNSKSQSIPDDSQDSNVKARPTELFDLFSFSSKDLEFVVKFAEEHGPDLFRQILHSICPSIYGHELVKGKYPFRDEICVITLVACLVRGRALEQCRNVTLLSCDLVLVFIGSVAGNSLSIQAKIMRT